MKATPSVARLAPHSRGEGRTSDGALKLRDDGREQVRLVVRKLADREDLLDAVRLQLVSAVTVGGRTHAELDRKGEVLQITNERLGSRAAGGVALDVDVGGLNDASLALERGRDEAVDKLVASCDAVSSC